MTLAVTGNINDSKQNNSNLKKKFNWYCNLKEFHRNSIIYLFI